MSSCAALIRRREGLPIDFPTVRSPMEVGNREFSVHFKGFHRCASTVFSMCAQTLAKVRINLWESHGFIKGKSVLLQQEWCDRR